MQSILLRHLACFSLIVIYGSKTCLTANRFTNYFFFCSSICIVFHICTLVESEKPVLFSLVFLGNALISIEGTYSTHMYSVSHRKLSYFQLESAKLSEHTVFVPLYLHNMQGSPSPLKTCGNTYCNL